MKKLMLLSLIILTLFLNSACWDMLEIENRAYITAIGIDNIEGQEDLLNILVTYEYPNLSESGNQGTGGSPRFTICSEGPTLSDISRQVASRMDKDIFFKHLKVIVIGEDIANDEVQFSKIFKALDRSPDIGRKIVMLIADGKAKDVILTEMEESPIVGHYISDIRQRQDVGKGYNLEDIGEILNQLRDEDRTFIIGRIRSNGEEIELGGSSVIKGRKTIGKLDEKETDVVMILKDELNEGKMTIVKDSGQSILTYIIKKFEIERDMKIVDGNIKFAYNIKNEGFVEEYMEPEAIITETDITSTDKIKEIEKEINGYMEEIGLEVINKLQNELEADVLEVDKYTMNYHTDLWNQLKDNWSEEFAKIDFTINVDTKIRRTGLAE